MKWTGHVVRIQKRKAYSVLLGILEEYQKDLDVVGIILKLILQ
jgi:hypothetical protein